MEINIVDNDRPGTLAFAKRGQLVSETTKKVDIEVVRTNGTDGVAVGHWKTVPDPTGGVKHPTPMLGKITFQHGEVSSSNHTHFIIVLNVCLPPRTPNSFTSPYSKTIIRTRRRKPLTLS